MSSESSGNIKNTILLVDTSISYMEKVEIIGGAVEEEFVLPYALQWSSDDEQGDFYIQISESKYFEELVLNEKNSLFEHKISDLEYLNKDVLYYWRIKSENYCNEIYSDVYSFIISDEISKLEEDMIIPLEGFSPNGDGVNERWIVDGINDGELGNEEYPKIDVYIHNRQGVLVYSMENYDNQWKAIYNGNRVPIGNYHVQIYCKSDYSRNKKIWIYVNY